MELDETTADNVAVLKHIVQVLLPRGGAPVDVMTVACALRILSGCEAVRLLLANNLARIIHEPTCRFATEAQRSQRQSRDEDLRAPPA